MGWRVATQEERGEATVSTDSGKQAHRPRGALTSPNTGRNDPNGNDPKVHGNGRNRYDDRKTNLAGSISNQMALCTTSSHASLMRLV